VASSCGFSCVASCFSSQERTCNQHVHSNTEPRLVWVLAAARRRSQLPDDLWQAGLHSMQENTAAQATSSVNDTLASAACTRHNRNSYYTYVHARRRFQPLNTSLHGGSSSSSPPGAAAVASGVMSCQRVAPRQASAAAGPAAQYAQCIDVSVFSCVACRYSPVQCLAMHGTASWETLSAWLADGRQSTAACMLWPSPCTLKPSASSSSNV
jgi:hypothetical protein